MKAALIVSGLLASFAAFAQPCPEDDDPGQPGRRLGPDRAQLLVTQPISAMLLALTVAAALLPWLLRQKRRTSER